MAGHPELMTRALQEAERARGRTRPNPMVGCVIAKGQRVIAVGYHVKAGAPHAELVALRRAGDAARGADVYVTLEPCDHVGRTGPCTVALIEAGVGRVFLGTKDPNPIVNGRGVRHLRRAGVPVHVGLLGRRCRELNEAYEHAMAHRRPFVVAKVAQSLDGRVATRGGESRWITGKAARRQGHLLRNTHDGIVVGIATVLSDDPRLTCRMRGGRDPVRIVLDSQGRTPPTAALVRATASSPAPTWIFVGENAPQERCQRLCSAGAEVIPCPLGPEGRIDLDHFLAELWRRELLSILIEGGPTVHGAFFDAQAVQRLDAFVAPLVIGGQGAVASVGGLGALGLGDAPRLRKVGMQRLGDDYHLWGYPVFSPPAGG